MKTPNAPHLYSPRADRRVSRAQLLKLTRSRSTKNERRIAEILKRYHIHFIAKARIGRYEIDFLIGRVALEVDGSVHGSINQMKDVYLFNQGFVPLHIRLRNTGSQAVADQLISLIRNNNVRSTT